MNTGQLITLLGGWSAVLVVVSTWLSKLFTERLLSKWRRDEQAHLETLRNDLAGNRLLVEAAVRSFASGQDALQQKRVDAVERMWAAVLQMRERLSSPVYFFSILLPSEYDSVLDKEGGTLATAIASVDDDMLMTALKPSANTELDRPLLGETLWLQFFIYRAFLGRLGVLIVMGKRKRHIPDWRGDTAVRQLLSNVLPKDRLDEILSATKDPSAVNRAVDTLEWIMLEEMSRITSGRRSSFESFQNAKDLNAAVAKLGARPLSQSEIASSAHGE